MWFVYIRLSCLYLCCVLVLGVLCQRLCPVLVCLSVSVSVDVYVFVRVYCLASVDVSDALLSLAVARCLCFVFLCVSISPLIAGDFVISMCLTLALSL